MTYPMLSPQRWRSSAISNPCSAASSASRSCARLDPRSVTSFVPNLCLATLTSCSSAPSRASPRSSIDPADSRSLTPFGRLWTMLPRLVRDAARREGANLLVAGLDHQSPGLSGESSDRPLVSAPSAGGQELLPRPRVCVDAEGPPSLDRRPQSALGSLLLERKHLVQFVFLAPRNRHRRNRVMPQLEMSPMRSSGRRRPWRTTPRAARLAESARCGAHPGTRARARRPGAARGARVDTPLGSWSPRAPPKDLQRNPRSAHRAFVSTSDAQEPRPCRRGSRALRRRRLSPLPRCDDSHAMYGQSCVKLIPVGDAV